MRYILAILFCFCSFPLLSQNYEGRVTDEHGEDIVAASVIVYDAVKTIVGFTRTDANGHFYLKLQTDKTPQTIVFSSLGFSQQTININNFKPKQVVILTSQAIQIKEVQVKSQAIRANGDTLSYLVGDFKGKQDRSIADVISKMPGLRVLNNGTIQYMGVNINKFYIEGMDLLGGQYSQASENLSAENVASVQVLENHQPVKALKNIQFSQQAAINLVLKNNAKNVWSGYVDAGTGASTQNQTEWLRDLRLIEMIFGKKKQSISMLKMNNTGKDVLSEVIDLTNTDQVPTENGILQNISLSAPELEESHTRFNNSYLFATNWLFNTKHNDEFRVKFSALWDRSQQRQDQQTEYLDADSGIVVQRYQAHSIRNEWNGEMKYSANRDNFYLNNTLTGYADFNKSDGITYYNNYPHQQNVEPHRRYITDYFELVKKTGQNQSFRINSQLAYNYLPSSLLLINDSTHQQRLSTFFWDLNAFYQHTLCGLSFTYKSGVTVRLQKILSGTSQTLNEYAPYLEHTTLWNGGRLQMRFSQKLSWNHRELNNQQDTKLIYKPTLTAMLNISNDFKVSALYTYSWNSMPLSSMTTLPLYTDYMTRLNGNGQLTSTSGQNANVEINYHNIMSGWFASTIWQYISHKHGLIYRSNMIGDFYTRTVFGEAPERTTYTISSNVGKVFGLGKYTISLNGSMTWNHYPLELNGTTMSVNGKSGELGLRFAAKPTQLWSVEEVSKISYNTNSLSTSFTDFRHQINLYLFLGTWQLSSINELYHSNDHSVSFNYFSDLSISYKKKSYEIEFTINNLLGNEVYRRHCQYENMTVYTINQLRPREVMAHVIFNI